MDLSIFLTKLNISAILIIKWLAQYENGSRIPKVDVAAALAKELGVLPKAMDVPDIDSDIGLMHTPFTLEDRYGLEVCECEDEVICASIFIRAAT